MKKKVNVSLYKGKSRYDSVLQSMNFLKEDILSKLKNKKKIIIKPNCVSDTNQLASTHVDAIKAVIDFIGLDRKVTLAEGSAYDTEVAFRNFNYSSLKENYNIKFLDLNSDKFEEIELFDKNFNPMKLGLSKTMLNSDCIISLALLKTHDSVLGTFSIKNVAVGSLIKTTLFPHRVNPSFLRKAINRLTSIRNDKVKMHQGSKAMNKNLFEIYKKLKPKISVIDGWEAMEGNGPVGGTLVNMNLAISGTNPLAVDCISSKLMGLNPRNIGYLNYCIDYEKLSEEDIRIVGNTSLKKEKRKFKLHDNYKSQLSWKI